MSKKPNLNRMLKEVAQDETLSVKSKTHLTQASINKLVEVKKRQRGSSNRG